MIKTENDLSSVLETTISEYATASQGSFANTISDATVQQLNSSSVNQNNETFITPDDIEDFEGAHFDDLSTEYNLNDEIEEERSVPQLPNEEEDEEELRKVRLNAFIEAVPSKEGVHVHPLYYKLSNQKGFEKYRLERQGTVTQVSARTHHLNFGNECFGFQSSQRK